MPVEKRWRLLSKPNLHQLHSTQLNKPNLTSFFFWQVPFCITNMPGEERWRLLNLEPTRALGHRNNKVSVPNGFLMCSWRVPNVFATARSRSRALFSRARSHNIFRLAHNCFQRRGRARERDEGAREGGPLCSSRHCGVLRRVGRERERERVRVFFLGFFK